MRLVIASVAIACAALPVALAEDAERATITIVTSIRGNQAITETFSAPKAAEDGSRTIEATIQSRGGPPQNARTSVAKDGTSTFRVDVGGATALDATLGGGKASVAMAGQDKKEIDTKATVVLENLLWHQYVFLLQSYDAAKGGAQGLTGFLPTQAVDFPLTVERGAEETYTVDGKAVVARRWKVAVPPGLTLDLWSDAAGIPLLVLIPSQSVQAVRAGFESMAEAVSNGSAPTPSPAPADPGYVKAGTFRETDVTVGAGEWALPGTLAMPAGEGKHPALVLVHGSGPNDRNETIGANAPFRDLARGLASKGVAVLRYDKRTLVHGAKIVSAPDRFTVKEETVDDALEAVALLARTPGIDTARIFVLGHSLGGMLIPRVASHARATNVAGYIVMAGTARPLQDVYLDQVRYLLALDGEITPSEQAKLAEIERQNARLVDPAQLANASAADLPLGLPAAYWKDLEGYRPAEAAKAIERPVLILQGERDYQVTMADFALWKTALGSKPNVTFRTYPGLNHLFIAGEGTSSPAEYSAAGHVAQAVIDDIAAWVLAGSIE